MKASLIVNGYTWRGGNPFKKFCLNSLCSQTKYLLSREKFLTFRVEPPFFLNVKRRKTLPNLSLSLNHTLSVFWEPSLDFFTWPNRLLNAQQWKGFKQFHELSRAFSLISSQQIPLSFCQSTVCCLHWLCGMGQILNFFFRQISLGSNCSPALFSFRPNENSTCLSSANVPNTKVLYTVMKLCVRWFTIAQGLD